MRALLAAAAVALCACPLPQPLPSVGRTDGGTVTPPRILVETAVPADGLVAVGTACGGSEIVFDADLEDPDLDDLVEARWFVDYKATPGRSAFVGEAVPPSTDGVDPRRVLTPFRFPLANAAAGDHHLVELVVSNGFYPALGEPRDVLFPGRTPQPGYETSVFRWMIVYSAGEGCP